MAKKKAKTKTKKPKVKTAAVEQPTQWQTVPLMGKPQPPANLGTCSACIKYDTPTSTCRETAPGFTTAPPAGTFPLMPVRWPIVNPTDWCYQWSLT
jgi:hypothetical protein